MDYLPSLAEALSAEDAVVYVGAGASAPSGLPLWRDFLIDFLKYAKPHLAKEDKERADKFLQDGDFLLVAEILQRGLDKDNFKRYLTSIFDPKSPLEPNEIHRSIARLPFSLAITTNFDNLLEAAYRNTPVHTWQKIGSVFDAIRRKKFAVVKLHGSIRELNEDSLRLTRTQYTYLTGQNWGLNDCLKGLLTWKTFLFVGHSLRDSDLLRLMDETRIRFGDQFGPHYAILPRSEVEGRFSDYLWEALSIRCITYEVDKSDPNSHERGIVSILRKLAGEVAMLKHEKNVAGIGDFSIPRAQAAQYLLNDSVRLTGSIRGEVYMIESDESPELKREAVESVHQTPVTTVPPLYPDSVIHTAFLQASALNGRDYIYIKDVSNASEDLKDAGYANARYIQCDPWVRSELAHAIVADGRRVGVLNLESDLEDAYTPDHIEVTRSIALQLGQIYLHSERRRRASVPLGGYYKNPNEFEELLNNSRLIRTMNHDFILYEIDYEKKWLEAHHANDPNPFYWPFDVMSLARQVFRECRAKYIADTGKELFSTMPKTQLNAMGVQRFNISGPLFACPVRVGGQTEAVLVTWLRPSSDTASKNRPKVKTEQWFQSSAGQVSRLANLLANDIYETGSSRARDFLKVLYRSLKVVDRGNIWTLKKLRNRAFRDRIMEALMSALLAKACGLRCVRVWRTSRIANLAHEAGTAISASEEFECIDSLTTQESTAPKKPQRKAYAGNKSPETDAYCRYTIARFSQDPSAKWQHPKMFGQPDNNAENLDKAPDGPWFMVPIVRPSYSGGSPELLGFISADSHDRSSGVPLYLPELDPRVIGLQCRIMDLISELARHLIAVDVPRSGTVGP